MVDVHSVDYGFMGVLRFGLAGRMDDMDWQTKRANTMGRMKAMLLDEDWEFNARLERGEEYPVSVERHPQDRSFYSVWYYDKEVGFVQWSKLTQTWRAVSATTHRVHHVDSQNQAVAKVLEEMA